MSDGRKTVLSLNGNGYIGKTTLSTYPKTTKWKQAIA